MNRVAVDFPAELNLERIERLAFLQVVQQRTMKSTFCIGRSVVAFRR